MYKFALALFIQLHLLISLNLSFAQTTEALYNKAVSDAAYPEATEVVSTLINLYDKSKTRDTVICFEKYVLVTTLKERRFSYPYSGYFNTGNRETWVTAVPEIQEVFRTYPTTVANKSMRAKQLLGMPPWFKDSCFVEMWVKPEDVFRPCPDQEIDDNTCLINYQGNVSFTHVNWMMNNKTNSCCNPDTSRRYPWTQLGYTYDWNSENNTHIGLSEFVVKKNSDVIIRKIYSTEEYLK